MEGDNADTTVGYDQAAVDPDYNADSDEEPARVWLYSQAIRELIDRKGDPFEKDRKHLTDAVLRQLQTLALFREVKLAKDAAKRTGKKQVLTLFVLLFPGEGRDNTGIKDLNDKVLGYKVTSGFIEKRQEAIAKLFWDEDKRDGPRYVTVGQDYKTASIVAYEKKREQFAADLVKLDAKLREELLAALGDAERDPESDAHLAEIKKLRRILEEDEKYRFDFLFGTDAIDPAAQRSEVDAVFLLLTQALKGAGIARFVSKGTKKKQSKESKKIVGGTGAKPDSAKLDPRGKVFDLKAYRRTTKASEKIKELMTTPYSRDVPRDYITILVDTVWTVSFLYHRKVYSGNPDVIRDVRKKQLRQPKLKEGIKYTFGAQKDLLELWLVALNMLDFVKDFLVVEFRQELVAYHELCYEAFKELRDLSEPIDWQRLERILTRDLRLTRDRILVQGTTSEYQFYAYASDYPHQIFITMDIRDLGVELMAWYEVSGQIIQEDKLAGPAMMQETFRSTEPINSRKRFTYDAVVAVMRKYMDLARKSDARGAALKAFGAGLATPRPDRAFDRNVQVMLGGDEIFVAAHPYLARWVPDIIGDLDKTKFNTESHSKQFGSQYLNMRAAVTYSKSLSGSNRYGRQLSHDKAMRLAGHSSGALKTLERCHRRIERLIDMLEAKEKKKKLAPPFIGRLHKLGMLKLFARGLHGRPNALSTAAYENLLALLDRGDVVAAQKTKSWELVDFAGNVVDAEKLDRDARKLEAEVRLAVGPDNIRVDGPPVTKMPWLAQEIVERIWPQSGE